MNTKLLLSLISLLLLTSCGSKDEGDTKESSLQATQYKELQMRILDDPLFCTPAVVDTKVKVEGCEADLQGIEMMYDGSWPNYYYYKAYTPRMGEILSWEEYTAEEDERFTKKGDKWLFCHFLVEQGPKTEAYKKLIARHSPFQRDYLADGPVQVIACFIYDTNMEKWNYRGIVAIESLLIHFWNDHKENGMSDVRSYDRATRVCPLSYFRQVRNF